MYYYYVWYSTSQKIHILPKSFYLNSRRLQFFSFSICLFHFFVLPFSLIFFHLFLIPFSSFFSFPPPPFPNVKGWYSPGKVWGRGWEYFPTEWPPTPWWLQTRLNNSWWYSGWRMPLSLTSLLNFPKGFNLFVESLKLFQRVTYTNKLKRHLSLVYKSLSIKEMWEVFL